MSANHQASVLLFDGLLDRIVHDLTGVTVPPRPTPLTAFEVTATDSGLSVTTIPAALSDSTFIAAQPGHGLHWTITFLDNGQYLHAARES